MSNQIAVTPGGAGGGATDFSGLTGQATLAQLPTLAANTLLGNPSGSSAVPSAITLAATLLFAAGVLTTGAFTGDVTASQGSHVTTVAKIQGTTVAGVTGSGNVVFATAPSLTGKLTVTTPTPHLSANGATILVNGNTAAEVVFTHPVAVHVQGADGENCGFHISAYGANTIGAFIARHALGTAALPQAETADTQLLKIAAWGYRATGYSNNIGGLGVFAAGTFTDISTPTYVSLLTNASGTTNTIVEVLRGQPGGGVSIGDAAYNATDRATGILAVKTGLTIGSTAQTFPASGAIAGTSDAQTLTNKTIAGGSNTISGVALASLASIANNTLLGNSSGSSAAPAAQTLGATLAFSGSALQTQAGTGDVAWSANSFVTTVAANFPRLDAASNAFTGALLSISGGATLPTPTTNAALQIARGTASGVALELDSFNGNPFFTFRRANTSSTAPSAIVSGNSLGNIQFSGWNTSAYAVAAGVSSKSTATTWDGSHNGAFLSFTTTADSSATGTEQMRLQGSGGLSVGNANVATDPGAGGITASHHDVGSNQVVGARVTGYTAMTGTPDKATAYATSTVTLAQLAGRMMQLQADLTTHGLIGA